MVTALSATADQTIVVSQPADAAPEKTKSSVPAISYSAYDFNAPQSSGADFVPEPPAPRPQAMNNNASVGEALDRRKNWMLLTPAQILGVQSPEEVMQGQEPSGTKKLSLEEQFLLRAGQPATASPAKNRLNGTSERTADWDNTSTAQNTIDDENPFRPTPPKSEPSTRFFNPFLSAPASVAAEANTRSIWDNSFTQPTPPKPTPDQIADQERFRALLSPSEPPAEQPQMPTRFSVAPTLAPDPFLQALPAVNPAGQGIAPLGNLFSRPAGIQPLPGIRTPPPPPVASKPSWQAQLPPWMQSGALAHHP